MSQAVLYGVAQPDRAHTSSGPRSAAIESLRKVLCRADLVPVAETVDEAIKTELQSQFDCKGQDLLCSGTPLDLVMRWASGRRCPPICAPLRDFEDDPPRGAGGERQIWSLLNQPPYEELRGWLHPQLPMSLLVGEADNKKRPDFVIAAPWSRPYVWEAHGHKSEHDKAKISRLQQDRWLVRDWEVTKGPLVTSAVRQSLEQMLKERPDPAPAAAAFLIDAAWVASQVECVTLWLLATEVVGKAPRSVLFRSAPRFESIVAAAISELQDLLQSLDSVWSLTGDDRLSCHEFCQRRTATGASDKEMLVVDIDPEGPSYFGFDQVIEEAHFCVRRQSIPADLPGSPLEVSATRDRPDRPVRVPGAAELTPILRRAFQLQDFRPGQLEAIQRAIMDRDALVLFPTGHGKSLVFQLSSLLLPGPSLVVEPYTALIDDQERNLRELGFGRVAALHSGKGLTPRQQAEMVASADIIYVAPERLHLSSFVEIFVPLVRTRGLGLFVVDEAHTVSQFGHAFRPSYLDIVERVASCCRSAGCAAPRVLALTATAPQRVIRDVQALLGIGGAPISLDDGRGPAFARRGHLDEIIEFGASADGSEAPSLLERLREVLPPGKLPDGQGIVFCPSKGWIHEDTVIGRVSQFGAAGVRDVIKDECGLVDNQIGLYTGADSRGAIPPAEMASFAKRFSRKQTQIMVATSAFGTGVNLQGVRWTVHVGMPAGLEAYYQETGRAGRDGNGARNWLLIDFDAAEQVLYSADDAQSDDPLSALRDRLNDVDHLGSVARQLRLLVGEAIPEHNLGISKPLLVEKWRDGRKQSEEAWLPSFPGVEWEIRHVAVDLHEQLRVARPGSSCALYGNSWWADWMRKSLHRLAMLGIIEHGFEARDHGDGDIVEFRVKMALDRNAGEANLLRERCVAEVLRITGSADRAAFADSELQTSLAKLDFPGRLTECSRALLRAVYRVVYEIRIESLRSLVRYAKEQSQAARHQILEDYFSPSDFKTGLFDLCKLRASIETLRQAKSLLAEGGSSIGALEVAASEYPASLVPQLLLSIALLRRGDIADSAQYASRIVTAEEVPWDVRRWAVLDIFAAADSDAVRRSLLDEFGRSLPKQLSFRDLGQLFELLSDGDGESSVAAQLVSQYFTSSLGVSR